MMKIFSNRYLFEEILCSVQFSWNYNGNWWLANAFNWMFLLVGFVALFTGSAITTFNQRKKIKILARTLFYRSNPMSFGNVFEMNVLSCYTPL